jgi:hypothetical protein
MNMFIDCGTKEMDVSHFQQIVKTGRWCAKYEAAFVKQGKTKAAKPKPKRNATSSTDLPGVALSESDPMFQHVLQLGDVTGWHQKDGVVIQVARNAWSYRTPRPRFLPSDYPLKSSFARFDAQTGSVWRRLETEDGFEKLPILKD